METISYSRYKVKNTLIHKIDPITKFILFVALTILVFLSNTLLTLTVTFVFVFIVSIFIFGDSTKM